MGAQTAAAVGALTYKYLTFDCYGTLVDWKTGIKKALKSCLGELPLSGKGLLEAYVETEKEEESSYKKYREVLGSTAGRLANRYGATPNRESLVAFAGSVPDWPAFPDTYDALREFGRMGFSRYILSNVDTDLLRSTIEKQKLEVDGYVTAEEVGSYKPSPGHWLKFMGKTSAERNEILHVAQSLYHDILPAQRLGIEAAWVNRYRDQLQPSASPLFIADSLASVAQLLGR